MIVRKIRREDLEEYYRVKQTAFEWGYTRKTWQERLSELEAEGNIRCPWQNHLCAFGDDDKTMMGVIGINDLRIRFDGAVVNMAGVGGVCSLPEYRHRGVIRECFTAAFKEMRENGQIFSQLYPFSTAYYRQYGYEMAIPQSLYRFPLTSIQKRPAEGTYKAYAPGDDISDLVAIYERCAEGVNHMVVREKPEWDEIKARFDTTDHMGYTYSYRDKTGRPVAYICMDKTTENGKNILFAKEMLAETFEGFSALMQLVRGLSNRYDAIHIFTMDDFRAEHAFTEFTHSGWHWTRFRGMTRVIDVQEVLKIAAYKGDGEIILRISDARCPWNTDTFHVVFEKGRAVSVTRTAEAPDAEADIGDFTALISGRYGERDFDFIPGMRIFKNRGALAKVFFKKRSYSLNLF